MIAMKKEKRHRCFDSRDYRSWMDSGGANLVTALHEEWLDNFTTFFEAYPWRRDWTTGGALKFHSEKPLASMYYLAACLSQRVLSLVLELHDIDGPIKTYASLKTSYLRLFGAWEKLGAWCLMSLIPSLREQGAHN